MTPIKVSNETTDSFIAPNSHNPHIDETPTIDMIDKIIESFVVIYSNINTLFQFLSSILSFTSFAKS